MPRSDQDRRRGRENRRKLSVGRRHISHRSVAGGRGERKRRPARRPEDRASELRQPATTPLKTTNVARKAILNDGVSVRSLSCEASTTIALVDVATEHKVPVISPPWPQNTKVTMTDDGRSGPMGSAPARTTRRAVRSSVSTPLKSSATRMWRSSMRSAVTFRWASAVSMPSCRGGRGRYGHRHGGL